MDHTGVRHSPLYYVLLLTRNEFFATRVVHACAIAHVSILKVRIKLYCIYELHKPLKFCIDHLRVKYLHVTVTADPMQYLIKCEMRTPSWISLTKGYYHNIQVKWAPTINAICKCVKLFIVPLTFARVHVF